MLASLWVMTASAGAETPGGPVAEPPAKEIVVTGERARRSLKETASSVAVVGRDEIEARAADRVTQVLSSIPNVQLGTGSQGPAIRGQDTTGPLHDLPAFLGGNRPRTALVVDGRAETYSEFVFGPAPLWDVERIELFRSPQTTTQGQNSIAGAIFVTTADPTFTPEYHARAIVGSLATRQLSAVASLPLGSDVAARISGDFRYSHTASRIRDRIVGGDPNHDVYGLLRAKLLAEPAWLPGAKAILTYVHQQSQAPQIVGVTSPFKQRRDDSGFYGTFRIRADSLTGRATFSSGRLDTAITLSAGDSSAKRLAPAGFGQAWTAARDWSAEGVVDWNRDGTVELTGGLSHRNQALNQRIDLSVLSGKPHFRDWQDGTGIFGEARFRPGSRLTVATGLRYQSDRQKRAGSFDASGGSIDLDYDRSFHALLPKASIAYALSDSVTAGVMVQKAYNPGGTTLRFDTGAPDNFEAERLWDYEVFARASMLGGRLNLNGNLFYYDMRNAQRSKDIRIRAPNGRFVGFSDLFNVPKATTYGAEIEGRWSAGDRLTVRGGVGLLRTKIIEAGADYPQFQGREFDRSPHMTASASVDWRPIAKLRLSAQVRHHGPYSSDPEQRPFTSVRGATIADARAQFDTGRVSLFAYVRNLFDNFSVISRAGDSGTLEDPREVGVGVATQF